MTPQIKFTTAQFIKNYYANTDNSKLEDIVNDFFTQDVWKNFVYDYKYDVRPVNECYREFLINTIIEVSVSDLCDHCWMDITDEEYELYR